MFICQEFNSVDKKVKVPEKWKMSFNEVAIIYFEYLSNLISKYHSYGQDIFFLYCWFYLNLNHLVLSIKTWVPDAGVKTCRLKKQKSTCLTFLHCGLPQKSLYSKLFQTKFLKLNMPSSTTCASLYPSSWFPLIITGWFLSAACFLSLLT